MISKSDAKSLAVCYEAYMSAVHSGDIQSQRCWSSLLLKYQDETGVALINRATLVTVSAEYLSAA